MGRNVIGSCLKPDTRIFIDELRQTMYGHPKLDLNKYIFNKLNKYMFDKLNKYIFDKLNKYIFDKLNKYIFDKLNKYMFDKLTNISLIN
jgi:hypothetical protein